MVLNEWEILSYQSVPIKTSLIELHPDINEKAVVVFSFLLRFIEVFIY